MEKEFIPYPEALALKELGFDEPCFGLYHNDKTFYPTQCKSHEQFHGQICSAPLYQQAFRWFREKYGLRIRNYVFVNFSGDISEGFEIFKYSKDTIDRVEALTYEEAELECLKKLIQLAK